MNIAVVGGGTSGLVAAWLLGDRHGVTLFEADSVVGGNVRTLGGNVARAGLPPSVRLDAGVIEFDRLHFPRFHALMAELGVEMRDVPATTGLFLADGRSFHAPDRLEREYPDRIGRGLETLRHVPLLLARRRFLARVAGRDEGDLVDRSLSDFLDADVFGTWVKLLVTYAYSIPACRAGDVGASLAVPMLRQFLDSSEWTSVVGGTWTYVERILHGLRGAVRTDAPVSRVTRDPEGVLVSLPGQEPERFDAVVFAVTPDRILAILGDATEDERRRFEPWRVNEARTLVHSDTGLYARRGIRYYSEFDLFETGPGEGGYNAYLNRLCGVPDDAGIHYGLSLGIDDEIRSECVIHEQRHATPAYDVESLRSRAEIRAANGEGRTWYAGAWLGDGLQEGAVRSAEAVAVGLGGRAIGARR